MKTDIFTFDLPEDCIANEPATPRESAQLLHIFPDHLEDKHISDLIDLIHKDDILVFNDTKVIPARIYGTRGQAHIECTLFKQIDLSQWDCLIKNARRLKINDLIIFSNELTALVLDKNPEGPVRLQFNQKGAALMATLAKIGIMPLPPYIKRPTGGIETDKKNYQTVFAKYEGAVAAPTAGLHWTETLLKKLKEKGVQMEFLTLHVGGGTFLPVKVDDTDKHKMHAEFGIITPQTAHRLNAAKQQGKKIIAVGTTSLRLLESATDSFGVLHPFEGETDIFITPGYHFKFIDKMFTNFHLSGSTLFMLVCAFAGIDRMKSAYQHAIRKNYRFFSYGDACLIEKKSDKNTSK